MPSVANYCEDCEKVIPPHQKLCPACWKKKYGDKYDHPAPNDNPETNAKRENKKIDPEFDNSLKQSLTDIFQSGTIEKATPAWQRKAGKNPKGGLNAAGRASAAREGHHLKPPVKSNSGRSLKDLKRRYSFLSRMSGNPGPERKPNGEPTRLLLSLQVWGASSKADARSKAAALKRRIDSMESTKKSFSNNNKLPSLLDIYFDE